MITSDNLKEVLLSITDEELQQVRDSKENSFVALELNILNPGWFSSIQIYSEYDENVEKQVISEGNKYLTKEEFLCFVECARIEKFKVKFMQWECYVEKKYYNNNQIALSLTHPEDGPIATATVNLGTSISNDDINNNYTYIKTWSENEGILEALFEAGIIELTNKAVCVNSFGSMAVLVKVLI